MRTNAVARLASILLAAEGIGIAALGVWEAVAIVTGDTTSVTSTIALIVLTLSGAALVLTFAAAVWRGRSWGRSGGIVTQLLILAVALGAATGAYADPGMALSLAIPAIVTLALLAYAAWAAGRAAKAEGAASR